MEDVLGPHERFVGVIADPPWVASGRTARFPEDPLTAIDGGPDGLDVAWRAVTTAAGHLVSHGWLLLQLGDTEQTSALQQRLQAGGVPMRAVEVREYDEHGVLVHLVRV
jgi:methylase of polypeptide subunit release factors